MYRKITIKNIVHRELLDKKFIKDNKLSRHEIMDLMNSKEFGIAVAKFDDARNLDNRFDSKKISKILTDNTNFFSDEPLEGWCQFVFLYIRHGIFSHLEAPKNIEKYYMKALLFIQIMRSLYIYEHETMNFDPTYEFQLLSDKDTKEMDCIREYKHLKSLTKTRYIYEFMRIGSDITPFNTVGHIGGVHYVAMLVGRQLRRSGIPVDLGLVSGAAAGHDIGKYGCRKEEERRVPYLHYFYTNQCLTNFGMPIISHIASNHSTWDLEYENLSVESLILIYSDFRVKSSRNKETGKEEVNFYSLKDSFQVILDKLDNVDEAKKHRYVRVYNKLKDFEDFMVEHGVHTEIPEDYSMYEDVAIVPSHRDATLLYGNEVCMELKYKAIDHNIRVMRGIYIDQKFGTIIESARTERRWKNLRTYISIFDEYSKYMLDSQKIMTMNFLYEMLMHKDDDVRRQAAEVLGNVVSNYTEEFRKELPEGISLDRTTKSVNLFRKYIKKILKPDYMYTEQQKNWIRSCFGVFVNSAINHATKGIQGKYFNILEKEYKKSKNDESTVLVMILALMNMDKSVCSEDFYITAKNYLRYMQKKGSKSVKIASLYAARLFINDFKEETYCSRMSKLLETSTIREEFQENLSNLFLQDMRSNTAWTIKVANISLMIHFAKKGMNKAYLLHVATHLVNLIKMSESITVRSKAGEALLEIIEFLPIGQRNEIAAELLNGLESGDYQFVKYIPEYLGKILLKLPPIVLDDFIDRMKKALPDCQATTGEAIIGTVGVVIANYEDYEKTYKETDEIKLNRCNTLVNILTKQAAGYRDVIYQEAFIALGRLFQSKELSPSLKGEIFAKHSKKILSIVDRHKENKIDFYTYAKSLNCIYRFIGYYQWDIGEFPYEEKKKIAFFPGTFDPFSLGHKAIAMTIRDLGMEVFLALDEFSWSKKTQPRLERRKILEMSIAGQNDIYVFPDDIPVNIANPKDIKMLKDTFEDKEVYIAVGSDVVENASCYKGEHEEHSIHSLNHIIFLRELSGTAPKIYENSGNKAKDITGEIKHLSLPKYYEDISSTIIRENIDSNRDISNLIDPMAQNYIYSRGLYLREPEYKHVMIARGLHISHHEKFPENRIDELKEDLETKGYNINKVKDYLQSNGVKTVYFQRGMDDLEMRAFAASKRVTTDKLIDEFKNVELASKIREIAGGRIASIGMLFSKKTKIVNNPIQYIVTELLTELIHKDYTYAIYNPIKITKDNHKIIEALKRQGFINIAEEGETPIYGVDLRSPVIIFKDVEEVIKAPLNKNHKVIRVMEKCHNRMLQSFTEMYPGKLIISFSTSALYNKIIEKVADINQVSLIPDKTGKRGPYMSVPFGSALTGVIVPNTVTKTLHTEKYFNNSMTGFRVGERKYYSSLDDQIKTVKSFNRPVILIDDLLHKGYRLEQIRPIFAAHDVEIKSLVVGVLTGRAQDRMKMEGVDVHAAYNLPKIEFWLNEQESYPFIGGNSIDSNYHGDHFVNMIMPFSFPQFINNGDYDSIYQYSITCLKNAYDLLKILEIEYQNHYEKKLTLKRLGEVIDSPKIPDLGNGVEYYETMAPSTYLENYIARQVRLGNPIQKKTYSI